MLNTLVRAANTLTLAVILQEQSLVRAERLKADARRKRGIMEKAEATYQYREEAHGNGMLFYTDCCGNRMYSVNKDPMAYHGKLCPKCFMYGGKNVTLYLRGTPDGIRVFENEHIIKVESEG